MTALGRPIVVLSSIEAISEVLEKKTSISSDRPYMAMASDMWVNPVEVVDIYTNPFGARVGYDRSVIWSPPDGHWTGQRKLFHQYLGPKAMPLYYEAIQKSILQLIQATHTSQSAFPEEFLL